MLQNNSFSSCGYEIAGMGQYCKENATSVITVWVRKGWTICAVINQLAAQTTGKITVKVYG